MDVMMKPPHVELPNGLWSVDPHKLRMGNGTRGRVTIVEFHQFHVRPGTISKFQASTRIHDAVVDKDPGTAFQEAIKRIGAEKRNAADGIHWVSE